MLAGPSKVDFSIVASAVSDYFDCFLFVFVTEVFLVTDGEFLVELGCTLAPRWLDLTTLWVPGFLLPSAKPALLLYSSIDEAGFFCLVEATRVSRVLQSSRDFTLILNRVGLVSCERASAELLLSGITGRRELFYEAIYALAFSMTLPTLYVVPCCILRLLKSFTAL